MVSLERLKTFNSVDKWDSEVHVAGGGCPSGTDDVEENSL